MRNTFIAHLTEQAAENPSVFLVVGDLGFSVVEEFRERFPDRFLNAGVAEQNMTSVAAGLAREGFKVFTYSIANFATLRCLEQIRNDVCYHALPVCVTAVGGGFMYGALGATHHATEDIAVMRALSHMRVFAPYSTISVRAAVDEILERPGPAYLRFGRLGEDLPHEPSTGLQLLIKQGEASRAIITAGKIDAATIARCENDSFDLWALCRIKPLPEGIDKVLAGYEEVLVHEDHQRTGGLFSALSEAAGPLKCEALNNAFASCAGKEDDLRETMIRRCN